MKSLAIFAGVLFVGFGIGGLVPALTTDGLLLGIFAMSPMQAGVYLASGILAIACALGGENSARYFFRAAGVLYALFAIAGFVQAHTGGELAGLAMNTADNVLNTGIAVASLWLGFVRPGPFIPPPGPRHDLRELA